MFEVVKLTKDHLYEIVERDPKAKYLKKYFTDETISKLEETSHTLLVDGRPILCGGITLYWENRGEAWAIMEYEACSKHLFKLHRTVLRYLRSHPCRRIEASVVCGFALGHRWVKLLGFCLEAVFMDSYNPDGSSSSLYSMVRREM